MRKLFHNAKARFSESFKIACYLWVQEYGYSKAQLAGGGLVGGLIAVVVTLVVMARAVPVLWPIAANSTAIDAMTGTDTGTTTIQSFWPIILLLCGLGLAVGLIMYAVRKFRMSG